MKVRIITENSKKYYYYYWTSRWPLDSTHHKPFRLVILIFFTGLNDQSSVAHHPVLSARFSNWSKREKGWVGSCCFGTVYRPSSYLCCTYSDIIFHFTAYPLRISFLRPWHHWPIVWLPKRNIEMHTMYPMHISLMNRAAVCIRHVQRQLLTSCPAVLP